VIFPLAATPVPAVFGVTDPLTATEPFQLPPGPTVIGLTLEETPVALTPPSVIFPENDTEIDDPVLLNIETLDVFEMVPLAPTCKLDPETVPLLTLIET